MINLVWALRSRKKIDRKLNWLCKNNQLRTWFEEKHHIVQQILTERVWSDVSLDLDLVMSKAVSGRQVAATGKLYCSKTRIDSGQPTEDLKDLQALELQV